MAQEHVEYLNKTVRDELIKASVAMYKAQPANKHQFLADYFAKLSAEKEGGAVEQKQDAPKKSKKQLNKEAKAAKKAAYKAQQKDGGAEKKDQAKPKKKKKVKMAMSDVTIEVTPDTNVEYDWAKIEADIADIFIDGAKWADKFTLIDFVFGLKKLVILCQIMDAKVPSTSVIIEAIQTVKGVGGVEMTTIRCADANWDNEGIGRIGTKRVAGKGGNGGKKGGKKKKKKKGKNDEPAVRVVDDAMIKKAADKICVAAKEADYYVCSVTDMDGSAQTNVTVAQLQKCLDLVRKKLPAVGLLLIASGSSDLTVLASMPGDKSKQVNCTEWIKSLLVFSKIDGDAASASSVLVCDPDKDEFPIKMKDSTSGSAFAYLKKIGVLDDGSEDEFYSMPADGDEEGY